MTRRLAAAAGCTFTALALAVAGLTVAAGPAAADPGRQTGHRVERGHLHHHHRHHGRGGIHDPRVPVIILTPVCNPRTGQCAF